MKIHPYAVKASKLKLRHSDNQRQLLYFKLNFLTATALFLKVPLSPIKFLLFQVNILKLHCHLFFSVHQTIVSTKSSTEAAIEGNAADSNKKLSDSPKPHIRVLGTVCQSYSPPNAQGRLKCHYCALTNQVWSKFIIGKNFFFF